VVEACCFGCGLDMTQFSDNQSNALVLAYRSAIEASQFRTGFLARTSHELRSPLNGVISSLQLILSDLCDDPAEEREYIQIAHDSALKLVELLDQVIGVARAAYGTYPFKIEAVDLDIALQEVAYQVRLLAENRNLRLDIPLLEQEIEVQVDANCLRQALVMVIDGAIAVMQEGAIAVQVGVVDDQAVITVVDDRPATAWAELVDLMATPSSPTVPLDKEALTQPNYLQANLSTNFRLVLARDLLESMQGQLALVEIDGKTHLAISLPIVNRI
jgi:signal transduction histidine kinase